MVNQYEIYWVNLDPTVGSEINKTRPGLIISPDDSNKHLNTLLIAPLTSTIRRFPMRVNIVLNGKKGQVALDQIRCVDKSRLTKKLGQLSSKEEKKLKQILKEYLID
ncbi:MAG: growth inhibitor PemK [Pseudooceanicola sp.]|nr:growth inhibitor PemK [Pseudooceanicola sp.]|tara:strand:+ start:555 stop:875 length:321 start_codon:yes stop_codon:yes gene_type:complete